MAVLGLHCYVQAFCGYGDWEYSLGAEHRLSCLIAAGSSQTRDRTCTACIGRQILSHRTTREGCYCLDPYHIPWPD